METSSALVQTDLQNKAAIKGDVDGRWENALLHTLRRQWERRVGFSHISRRGQDPGLQYPDGPKGKQDLRTEIIEVPSFKFICKLQDFNENVKCKTNLGIKTEKAF